MGCTASKLDNEDTVRRCKERRRLIKEAVYARHHLAAAHFDYCRSLRATGSALSDFAAGEPLSVSDSTPAVLLRNPSKSNSNSNSFSLPTKPPPLRSAAAASPAPSSIRPPPPPPYSPSSSSSPTIASSKLPPILSAASSVHSSAARTRRHNDPKPKPKIPHILSDSSLPATPAARPADKFGFEATYAAQPATPSSQASSVWNWENFYPPSPPDSEFFYNRHRDDHHHQTFQNNAVNFPKEDPHHHLDVDSEEEQREEVHCSEWGDHYSTSTSTTSESEPDADGDDERETARSEISDVPTASNFGSSTRRNASSVGHDHHHRPPSPHKYKGAAMGTVDEESEKDASPSVGWGYGVPGGRTGEVSDMRMVVRHRDLKEIVASIRDYFDKAAAAGDQVAEILETGRAQLDRSFRQLKKTVYHSSGVFTNLSSTWSSKPPLAVKYKLDAASLDEPAGRSKSICSTLERLLAWEKKLYDEVKDREGVKIAHEKKLKTLQSQEYKGEDEAKLDKTKTSIKRLQSLIIVTSQAVNTTSSAIVGLRDNDLVPQLIELCHGLLYMWRSMNQSHEFQNQVVQQVRGLVNQSLKGHSTSELHRQATRDLESAVASWHSSFCRFVQHQRDFIFSLHGWFNLTLLPVDSEVTNLTTTATRPSETFSFFDEWKLSLNRLPDKVASEAIKSFVNVVHVISTQQTEEIKMKRKTETASKELEKKASALRNIERKYYHSYSTVGLGLPNNGPDRDGQVLDARDPLAEKKAELSSCQRKVEEEILKHSKAVEVTRAMTLNNLQTGLPGVFQAMTSFSSLYVEAMETVCTRSYGIK